MRTVSLLFFVGVLALPWLVCSAEAAGAEEVAAAPKTSNPVDPTIIRELVGEWDNEMGSVLKIVSVDQVTGLIAGTYSSPSGTGGDEFPLTGWVNTAPPDPAKPSSVVVVSFSVRWGQYGSVTAWNGYYATVGSEAKVVGQWLLSRPNSQFAWDHILTGQDRFSRKEEE